mmetsp:Transcript_21077/g.40843  ORF Transcript_21077/g.40843 Transcript_21077/m.40843 type:complete len:220 (-) Transcript_21077:1074-1733(-)
MLLRGLRDYLNYGGLRGLRIALFLLLLLLDGRHSGFRGHELRRLLCRGDEAVPHLALRVHLPRTCLDDVGDGDVHEVRRHHARAEARKPGHGSMDCLLREHGAVDLVARVGGNGPDHVRGVDVDQSVLLLAALQKLLDGRFQVHADVTADGLGSASLGQFLCGLLFGFKLLQNHLSHALCSHHHCMPLPLQHAIQVLQERLLIKGYLRDQRNVHIVRSQ